MRSLLMILAFCSPVHAATEQAKAQPQPSLEPAATRPTMQQYAAEVGLLLQNIRAFDAHPSADQKQTVLRALDTLRGLSHAVRPTWESASLDPIMRTLSIDLTTQFGRIGSAYLAGNYPYARYLLRQTTQYCVACHAASPSKRSALALFPEPSAELSELERAEYFSATRRHEEAMVSYERFLKNKNFKRAEPELWEQAVENLLAITIRLRQQASITYEMLSALLDDESHLPAQKELLQVWRSSAKAWDQEGIRKQPRGLAALEKARQLIAQGENLAARRRNFGFIEFMRAAALLNELALSNLPDADKAAVYLLAGQSSENLRDVFIWMRPEAYYEACIRILPHSINAQSCLRRWQDYQQQYPAEALSAEAFQPLVQLAQ